MHAFAGDGGERLLGHEARAAGGQDGHDLRAVAPQQARQFQRLERGDGAGNNQQDAAAIGHGRSLTRPAGASEGRRMAQQDGMVSGAVLLWLRVEGLALLAAAAVLYAAVDGGWLLFAVLFLLPDVAMLGYLAGPRIGAAAYNIAHATVLPWALAALGWFAAPALVPIALIWLAHIGFDRAMGYGLKYPGAFGDTHLGRVGRGA